uniref:Lipocalin n=1 Tax=Rhipicephalus appendiculatus TaxID=34631 RepID=A0A131Z4D0_RHIAP
MNPLALAALASIIIASHGQRDQPIWQNESRLNEYQMAWTSLNKSSNVTYYQVSGTELLSGTVYNYRGEPMETNYTCWSVQMRSLNQSEQKGVRHYNFMVTAKNSVHFVDEPVATVSDLNYTTKNAVNYEYRKGCELWVKSEYKDNVPPCCSFIYDLLCDVEKSYDIYDQQKCRRVVDSLEKESG